MKLPQPVSQINEFFSLNSASMGSFERIVNLLDGLKNDNSFLLAGSWAIEGISGQRMEHDDIDLIILCNPPYYIDDAVTKEEHCCNIIPLSSDDLIKDSVRVKL